MRTSSPNARTPVGYYRGVPHNLMRSFVKMKSRYGITHNEFLTLLVLQDSKCFICKIDFVAMGQDRNHRPQVDHDHRTNEIRGLLCWNCNKSLHVIEDHREAVQDYLENSAMRKIR